MGTMSVDEEVAADGQLGSDVMLLLLLPLIPGQQFRKIEHQLLKVFTSENPAAPMHKAKVSVIKVCKQQGCILRNGHRPD